MEIKSLLDAKNAAIVMRQHLKPVEGDHAVVFPPTFAELGYNIDQLKDADGREAKNVCLMDSVGSQANRMEPIFKLDPYAKLIPHITVTVKMKNDTDETVDILDAGHRIADAAVRFSDMAGEIRDAFRAAGKGNAVPLAKLAPTSLVFGCWDSRDTGIKMPRIVRSTVRALNVHPLTRSAQFIPALENSADAFDSLADREEKLLPEIGLAHVPAPAALGGVLLDGHSQLLRESVLSLSALRRLVGESEEETAKLRAYVLGLSLVAFTAPQDTFLRMGCELTPDPENPATWEVVGNDGTRASFTVTHEDALAFARDSSKEFGVGESLLTTFDPAVAKKALEEAKKKKNTTKKGK
ncbi:MAG: type I-G CRISPR-associated RAMP protein Csb1/Cas7g [Candidatus Hydrogenedentales bacterium]|jgi:CRISPR-associated protein Csb1